MPLQGKQVFYSPQDGFVGDVIPFWHDGEFWLYYLLDRHPGEGTPWRLVRTGDFVDFVEAGTGLANGDAAADDFNAYTGSIVEADGKHHLFYTGQNPKILDERTGVPRQVVMHAISHDGMATWVKQPEDTFTAPADRYDLADWRDPFVFRPDPQGPWRMLIASRHLTGPSRRRGLIAQCVSWDLHNWEVTEPFWDPALYVTHECPDVFSMGEWWYLVYSEFSERFTTRYRMSHSPLGPWQLPPGSDGSVDARAFYAAKTAADERGVRYAFGWIPTRLGLSDDGAWEWAGELAVHQVVQRQDGTLDFRLPATIRDSFTETVEVGFTAVLGAWSSHDEGLRVSVPDGHACAVAEDLPDQFLLSADIEVAAGTSAVGVLLRASDDGDEGYAVRLEPRDGRITFDRWPRQHTGEAQWQIGGDVPQVLELERAADLTPGTHRLEVLVDGTAFVAYLDERVAMSGRMYDRRDGGLGLFVTEGQATFTDVSVRLRPLTRSTRRPGVPLVRELMEETT
ncbi:glycoside hydrolase [Nocardioides gansuensis]|uniref:beta-fructofuranosidase n=1 Tax=Nocardioides gansuensis TaxID=2138300 RepID=A0A2T8FEE8_9ACTN|nr:GH32 C-terminal domain-containing protein [Nocardioides gansuensis]PVG84084.1 glycoside hydrolase [Nocardioides gansuensis]